MADDKIGIYLWTWLGLLALLALNLMVSLLNFGGWVNLAIATLQALLVLTVFMYLRRGSTLLWLTAATGFLWLGLLYGLAESDYATRGEDEATGRIAPLPGETPRSPEAAP